MDVPLSKQALTQGITVIQNGNEKIPALDKMTVDAQSYPVSVLKRYFLKYRQETDADKNLVACEAYVRTYVLVYLFLFSEGVEHIQADEILTEGALFSQIHEKINLASDIFKMQCETLVDFGMNTLLMYTADVQAYTAAREKFVFTDTSNFLTVVQDIWNEQHPVAAPAVQANAAAPANAAQANAAVAPAVQANAAAAPANAVQANAAAAPAVQANAAAPANAVQANANAAQANAAAAPANAAQANANANAATTNEDSKTDEDTNAATTNEDSKTDEDTNAASVASVASIRQNEPLLNEYGQEVEILEQPVNATNPAAQPVVPPPVPPRILRRERGGPSSALNRSPSGGTRKHRRRTPRRQTKKSVK